MRFCLLSMLTRVNNPPLVRKERNRLDAVSFGPYTGSSNLYFRQMGVPSGVASHGQHYPWGRVALSTCSTGYAQTVRLKLVCDQLGDGIARVRFFQALQA